MTEQRASDLIGRIIKICDAENKTIHQVLLNEEDIIALKKAKERLTPARWITCTLCVPLSDTVKEAVRCSNCGLHFDFGMDFCPHCGKCVLN